MTKLTPTIERHFDGKYVARLGTAYGRGRTRGIAKEAFLQHAKSILKTDTKMMVEFRHGFIVVSQFFDQESAQYGIRDLQNENETYDGAWSNNTICKAEELRAMIERDLAQRLADRRTR